MGEVVNERPKQRSVMKLYEEFGENTTMHGLRRALTSRSRHRRCLWCLMVLSGFAVAVFHFVEIMKDYYSYPVTTVVSLKHQARMRFPAVTICNINRKRKSFLQGYEPVELYGMDLETPKLRAQVNVVMKYQSAQQETDYAHKLTDMLLKCLINKNPCSAVNFTELKSATYGNCYTFAPDDPKYMYTTRSGPQNGLILELDIEHREYIFVAPTAGVTVMVHEHDEKPFPGDGGIYAHPGVTTSIGLRKTVTHRLPKPYGDCISQHNPGSAGFNLFSTLNYKYTETACRKSCFQMSIFNRCECCDENLPCIAEDIFKMAGVTPEVNQTVPYCTSTNNFFCLMDVELQDQTRDSTCIKSCQPSCDQHTFEKVVSIALWPSDPYLDFVLYKINETVLKNMTFESKASLKRFIQTNFLRLEIYFDSLDYLEFASYPKYQWSILLGDVGGHLGLWMGFSILTAMEFIELFIDTVLACMR